MTAQEIKLRFLADDLSYLDAIELLQKECGFDAQTAETVISDLEEEKNEAKT